MTLESGENGPLIWPSIEENGVTRPKKYSELSATEAIQADCDIKATNIILQGLPPEVYALVSNNKVAKELWERIQLLMQGTLLTKQERECKLYDEFDKFGYKKGETLYNIIGELERPVSTRLQLHEQALFCYYDAFLSSVEPKTYKDALTQSCRIEAMQEELNEFEPLEVWELVPRPDKVMVITLK
ncbi:hypothetical protein Tco_0572581 [Tanacetum coccineum]